MAVTQNAPPQTGKTALEDDAFIHYQHYQHDSKELCVILVHSLAQDYRFWRWVAPAIASKVPVICVDLRGHGRSAKSAGPYAMSLFADDIKKVMRDLGYKKAIMAGTSLGGCVALQFSIDHPQLTAALALIDTTAWYGHTAPDDWEKRAQKARSEGFASMVPFQTTRWFSEQFRVDHPERVQQCVETFLANDVDAYIETCRAMGAFNASAELPKIRVPAAIVVGAEDYAAPVEMSQIMHDAIPDSTLTIIPAARHLTPVETPDVITETLGKLLKKASMNQ